MKATIHLSMNKKYVITGIVGLGIGVGAWYLYNWWKYRNTEVIRDGSFEIIVEK